MFKLKKLLRGLLFLILLVSLLGLAGTYSAKHALSNPNKVSGWLDQTNLYGSFTNQISSEAKRSLNNTVNSEELTSGINQTVETALPKVELNNYLSTIVNSNYSWLKGRTSTPKFTINLTPVKQSFSNQIDSYVKAHLSGLPNCSLSQTLKLINVSSNPLSLTCRPAGINISAIAGQLASNVSQAGAFLTNPIVTANSINAYNNNSGTPYYKTFHTAPKYYRLLIKLPLIFIAVSVISFLGLIALSKPNRGAIRKVGYALLISGIILIITNLITNKITQHINKLIFKQSGLAFLKPGVISFADKVEASMLKTTLIFGLAYLILALTLLCTVIALSKRTRKHKRIGKGPQRSKNRSEQRSNDYIRAIGLEESSQPKFTNSADRLTSHRNQDIRTAPVLEKKPNSKKRLIQ